MCSDHAEASRVLDRGLKALPKDLLRAIFWDEKLVEASMGAG